MISMSGWLLWVLVMATYVFGIYIGRKTSDQCAWPLGPHTCDQGVTHTEVDAGPPRDRT